MVIQQGGFIPDDPEIAMLKNVVAGLCVAWRDEIKAAHNDGAARLAVWALGFGLVVIVVVPPMEPRESGIRTFDERTNRRSARTTARGVARL